MSNRFFLTVLVHAASHHEDSSLHCVGLKATATLRDQRGARLKIAQDRVDRLIQFLDLSEGFSKPLTLAVFTHV